MRLIAPGADLHTHTVFSDGLDTVTDLIERAGDWLKLISICDHDTLEAYDHLPNELPDGLSILPGVELSCRLGRDGGLHLLGYFPTGFTRGFRAFVDELARSRTERVQAGVRRLREMGLQVRWADLEKAGQGVGVLCRSHVCRVLMDMGVGGNPGSLFRRYLFDNFDPPPVSAEEAVIKVRAEGGYPVWAHPHPNAVEKHGDALLKVGLAGLEAFTPSRRKGQIWRLCEWAESRGLFTTGGSDHHGLNPKRPLGTWRLDLERVPAELLA